LIDVARELHRVSHRGEQPHLEAAQHGRLPRRPDSVASAASARVVIEQSADAAPLRQQLQQKLVQIEAAQQREPPSSGSRRAIRP
jgi:hypothetical protein